MTNRTIWRWGASISASALLLSGCGMFDEAEPQERENLASLFGLDYSGDETDWREQDQKVQELVAQCMQEKGWEYIPVVYPDDWYSYDWDPSQERERIEREGFGITYWVLYPDAMVDDYDPGTEWVDPNQPYIESLTPEEVDAYYKDLYGDMMMFEDAVYDEVTGEYIEPLPIDPGMGDGDYTPGCENEAWEEVYGGSQDNPEVWDAMNVFYEEIYERVEADPRIIELNDEWVQCMKDAGYDYQSQDEFWTTGYDELYKRFEEILPMVNYDPMEGWTEEQINDFYENATPEEWDALYGDPYGDITPEQRSQLEALLADEIDLALAEHDCSSGHWDKYNEISAEVEENYIRENRAAIEEAAAGLEG